MPLGMGESDDFNNEPKGFDEDDEDEWKGGFGGVPNYMGGMGSQNKK